MHLSPQFYLIFLEKWNAFGMEARHMNNENDQSVTVKLDMHVMPQNGF